jgi:hypothetical protein
MGLFDSEFKRINFFRGFLTTEKDWNEAEDYHRRKRLLHNAFLHGAGVVPRFMGGLKVTGRGKGELAVEVAPGFALDGVGQEIMLLNPTILTIDPGRFKLPGTVYAVVRYVEELDDYVTYKESPDFKGHRKMAERVKVEVTAVEPDLNSEVELARIQMTPGCKRVMDARDPNNPKADEIDLRFVPFAGTMGSLSPAKRHGMAEFLRKSKITYAWLHHDQNIPAAADVMQSLVTTEMLLRAGFIDGNNIQPILASVLDLQVDMIAYVENNMPEFSSRKEFMAFKKNVNSLNSQVSGGRVDPGFLDSFMDYQQRGFDAMKDLFKDRIRVKEASADELLITPALTEAIHTFSGDIKDDVDIGGTLFHVADSIDFVDRASEAAHDVAFKEFTHKYRSRQKLTYPDGTEVDDVGTAITGGELEYKLRGLTPGQDLILTTRIDYVYGDWEQDIYVNGAKVGSSKCTGVDRKNRWRNWSFVVPAEFVTGNEITVLHKAMTADRDINFFHVWALQKAKKA